MIRLVSTYTVPNVLVVATLRKCPVLIALVKSIVNVLYNKCSCKLIVTELDSRFPLGPDVKRNQATVFVGSTDPPFYDLQLLHRTLAVKRTSQQAVKLVAF